MKKKKRKNIGTLFTPITLVSAIILAVTVFVAIFADVLAPYDPTAVDVLAMYKPAFTPGHLLGTDKIGRDLLSQLLVGSRSSMLNAFMIVTFEVIVGVPIGLICGYYGGWIDNLIMRIWDVVCSIPALLLSFILIAVMGKGTMTGVIAIGISFVPLTAKMARSLIMTEKKAVYVEACRSMGYSDARIIFVHILPNIMTTMVTQFAMDVGAAIVSMATLSYLGLGTQPPDEDWGTLLQIGMQNFYNNPVLLIAPTIVILVVTLAINLLSDGIEAYLDPSERKLPTFEQYDKRLLKMKLRKKKSSKTVTA